jgi:hypothetical protein
MVWLTSQSTAFHLWEYKQAALEEKAHQKMGTAGKAS